MKALVFSDIHGNYLALKELVNIEPPGIYDQYIFCGDLVGYYYESESCLEVLEGIHNLVAVKGNHDQMYAECFENPDMTKKLIGKYGNSYRLKSKYIKEYIDCLPVQATIASSNGYCLVQHGTPWDLLNGRFYPNTDIGRYTVERLFKFIICGHTHYQMCKRLNDQIWINPGSLGQPRDGKGFSYCIVDTETYDIIFKTINVNINDLIEQIIKFDPLNRYLVDVLMRNRKE